MAKHTLKILQCEDGKIFQVRLTVFSTYMKGLIQQIDFSSPQVMQYEAVHQINDWDDVKRRSGVGRRIFSFTHRLMPGEPLVILHTSLGDNIPSNIQVN